MVECRAGRWGIRELRPPARVGATRDVLRSKLQRKPDGDTADDDKADYGSESPNCRPRLRRPG